MYLRKKNLLELYQVILYLIFLAHRSNITVV